jgi:hypothetical protein
MCDEQLKDTPAVCILGQHVVHEARLDARLLVQAPHSSLQNRVLMRNPSKAAMDIFHGM